MIDDKTKQASWIELETLREKLKAANLAYDRVESESRRSVVLEERRSVEMRTLLASAYKDATGEVIRQAGRVACAEASEQRHRARADALEKENAKLRAEVDALRARLDAEGKGAA